MTYKSLENCQRRGAYSVPAAGTERQTPDVGRQEIKEEEKSTTECLLDRRMKRQPYAILSPLAFCLPLLIAWAILHATPFATSEIEWGLPLGMVVFSIAAITQLVATGILIVRRANDCGKNRGLVALLMIPVVNIVLLIYLMFPASVGNAGKV